MKAHPVFQPVVRGEAVVEALYLDTTYCNPKYDFPSQDQSVAYVVNTVGACLKGEWACRL